jgi:hypothetical protein
MHAERRFGDLVVPSELTVGWWYGTARYSPFFQATIHGITNNRRGDLTMTVRTVPRSNPELIRRAT